MVGLPLFGDEGKESCIESLEDLSYGSGIFNDFPHLYPDHRPTMVEKIAGEAIGSRSVASGGVLKCLIHFLDCNGPEKG